MPTYSQERQEMHRDMVRRLLVVNPFMSLFDMQRQLEENGVHLTTNYIAKVKQKTITQQIKQADRLDVLTEISSFLQMAIVLCETQWKIVLSSSAKNSDKVSAGNLILKTRNAVFEQLFNSKIFEKQGDTIHVTVEQKADPATMALVNGLRQLLAIPAEYAKTAPDSPKLISPVIVETP